MGVWNKIEWKADMDAAIRRVYERRERGFNRRQVMQLVGFHEKNPSRHFRAFLAEISPNALNLLDKSESSVIMPHGGYARFIPCGIIPDFAMGVIRSR